MFSGHYLNCGDHAIPLFTKLEDVNVSSAKIIKVQRKDSDEVYYARAVDKDTKIKYNILNRANYNGPTYVDSDISRLKVNDFNVLKNMESDYNQCTVITYQCACSECSSSNSVCTTDGADSAKTWGTTTYYNCNCFGYNYTQNYQSQCSYSSILPVCDQPTGFVVKSVVRQEAYVNSQCNCNCACACACCCNGS